MSNTQGPNDWIAGYRERSQGPALIMGKPHAQFASYSLRTLAEKGLLPADDVSGMLLDSGLHDFAWHVTWADDETSEASTPDDQLVERIANAEGVVIFIHGWTGSHAVWEDLPALVVSQNPRLVALTVDHNGFGETPFVDVTPDIKVCNPVAAMRAIERWVELLRLRRQPGNRKSKVITFVGHSMGGAALFFLDEREWGVGEQTRLAIAPALLLHDESHRAFYTALGLGIGLVGRLRALEFIDDRVAPTVLEILADGATQFVKDEHTRIYDATPKGVTARTFAAMGVIEQHPIRFHWELMRVILGHKDRLVGLIPALDLLNELHFNVDQIRVVLGTHYLFSIGESMARIHAQNRTLILQDILDTHEQALRKQQGH
jgi:pimeloyl-ACP methyl ester carboxylesterase